MGKVLELEQREQAGSGSYNRFEYQVHWIVCHIIGQLENNAECIVFCEFHDDMAEFIPEKEEYQFYQIKTKEDSSDWTVAELSKREKKKSGGYKKYFLGFIYYNFLNFGVECSHCYFISNNDYDKDVRLWQSYCIFSSSFLFSGCNIFSSALSTALSNGKASAAISFLRTFGFIAVFLLVLPRFLEVTGVCLAVPLTELFTLMLTVYLLCRHRKQYTTILFCQTSAFP